MKKRSEYGKILYLPQLQDINKSSDYLSIYKLRSEMHLSIHKVKSEMYLFIYKIRKKIFQ